MYISMNLQIFILYFGLQPNTPYLICCSNCSNFGYWELSQLAPLSLWHTTIILCVCARVCRVNVRVLCVHTCVCHVCMCIYGCVLYVCMYVCCVCTCACVNVSVWTCECVCFEHILTFWHHKLLQAHLVPISSVLVWESMWLIFQ